MVNFGNCMRLRFRIAGRGREAVGDRVGADDEIFFGVERLAGADHEVNAVVVAGNRGHHQDGIGFLGVQRAMGDIGDRKILDRLAAFQFEVPFGVKLVRRLLRRVGQSGQRQQAGGDESCDALHGCFPVLASYAGLTRLSIHLHKSLAKRMGCRVKPGNDE
jgi:hypothetical protein